MSHLQMNLLENALDFLEEAIDHILQQEKSPRHIKYGILHLSSAVELLLKQRLYLEDWKLIFQNQTKASKASPDNGALRTIGLEEALKRLEETCNIDFAARRAIPNKLRCERNKIEHFQMSIDLTMGLTRVVETWQFVLWFITDHLNDSVEGNVEVQYQVDRIMRKVSKVEEIVAARLKDIEPALSAKIDIGQVILDCPECLQRAVPLTPEAASKCQFCGHVFPDMQLSEDWVEIYAWWHNLRLSDRSTEPDFEICFNCAMEQLYHFGNQHTRPEVEWGCFNCGSHWKSEEIDRCEYCGELFEGMALGERCPNCFKRLLEED